jgi:histidinol-phosphate aminotransferase
MYHRVPEGVAGLRLHLNENTAGCSPAVLAALRSIPREEVARYPDYGPVTAACARHLGVEPDSLVLTNGLDEGLHVVAQYAAVAYWRTAARGAQPAALVIEPAFEMYEACADAAGLDVIRVPPGPNLAFPLDAVLASITPASRLIYLNDPHNPSGLGMPAGAVERIADAAPHALVLVDEAYAEFSGRTVIGPLLTSRRNVIAGRTFAKAHGLAGLRAGALIAHPATLDPIRRILPPYGLNVCAARALEAAVADAAYLAWFVAEAATSRQLIYDACAAWNFPAWPSEANFVLVRVGPRAPELVAALARRGILVRDRSAQPGCAGCIRIAAGVVEHTRRCLAALEDVLASRHD